MQLVIENEQAQFIGSMKFNGELVKDGFLDSKKSAQAILGFDEAVRFFILQQAPDLEEFEFEFPVKIQSGSWEVLIPGNIAEWIQTALGVGATGYVLKAVQKMADRDFENFGFKDLFIKALLAIQWTIKIGKHIGDLTIKTFTNLKFKNDNQEIGIPNSEGDYLFIPKEYFEYYIDTHPKLLSNIIELVDDERF